MLQGFYQFCNNNFHIAEQSHSGRCLLVIIAIKFSVISEVSYRRSAA